MTKKLLGSWFSALDSNKNRIIREQETVEKMIFLYCKAHHQKPNPCFECIQLTDYVADRLQKCRFKDKKPNCKKCPAHCYKNEQREKIREAMRYAGPRMMWHHPYLAVKHLLMC